MNHEEERREADFLLDKWRVIVKRKWMIVTFASALILLTAIYIFNATPMYKATATLLIDEEKSKLLSIEDEFGNRRQMTDLRFFNTQLKLLKSKSLAERVAIKMNLLSQPEFGAGKRPKIAKDKESDLKDPFNSYSDISESIQGGLEVSPITDTKLVEVSYIYPSPILVAEIVNTLAEEFINFSMEKRYEITQQASKFLTEQIADLRRDLTEKEQELQRYGQEKEIFFLSDTENTTVNKLADLNEAYTQSQIERVNAEASYRELKSLKADSLPQFVKDPAIQQLKTEYTQTLIQYKERSETFKESYPEMIQLKAKLDSIWNEIKKAVDVAEFEYQSALKKEASLKKLLERQRVDVAQMESDAILYNSLEIEVENNRKLLDSLIERQKETLISARLGELKTSNITIIDKAEVPKKPISPKKKKSLILTLLVGIFGGVLLCFLLEYLDNTVKGPEDVEKLTGLPSLGVIPFLHPKAIEKEKKFGFRSRIINSPREQNPHSKSMKPEIKEIELVNHFHPKVYISEDYRIVRTSILLSHPESFPKSILFTSTLPKEGKTVTVINMAVAFAQLGKKVLIIDADLRKPRLHKIFKVNNLRGLSDYLTREVSHEKIIQGTYVKNVWLLPSGLIPPNPIELLNSERMKVLMEKVRERFDVILIDSNPLLAVIDAVVVSSLTDSTMLILKPGKTTRKPFLYAVEELRQAKAKIIGVLFNGVKMKSGNYHSLDYYRYYRYHNYGKEEGKQQRVKKLGDDKFKRII